MASVKDVRQDEHIVVFELAGERFGVDIARVQEIIRPLEITMVPRAPEWVEGVINLRGRVIPVVNLGHRFGIPVASLGAAARIVVMDVQGSTVGALVDAVHEVLRVPAEQVEPASATLGGAESAHLRGIAKVGDNLVVLLDLDSFLDVDLSDAA